ncbi:hypothetical protein BCR42DRAFT_386417 [Absidia repens]|uniref:Uncharacterized protein n=1 Tax=Absidia repens TaxID=90262 RepID=A0A1X2J1T0_9FUNG|nr:hypothetical protein BCR42DRAFT_386417 [Absidia repens]
MLNILEYTRVDSDETIYVFVMVTGLTIYIGANVEILHYIEILQYVGEKQGQYGLILRGPVVRTLQKRWYIDKSVSYSIYLKVHNYQTRGGKQNIVGHFFGKS